MTRFNNAKRKTCIIAPSSMTIALRRCSRRLCTIITTSNNDVHSENIFANVPRIFPLCFLVRRSRVQASRTGRVRRRCGRREETKGNSKVCDATAAPPRRTPLLRVPPAYTRAMDWYWWTGTQDRGNLEELWRYGRDRAECLECSPSRCTGAKLRRSVALSVLFPFDSPLVSPRLFARTWRQAREQRIKVK